MLHENTTRVIRRDDCGLKIAAWDGAESVDTQMMTTVPAEVLERLDAFVRFAMERVNTPGMTLALTNGERPLVTKGYGYADIAAKT